MWGFVQNGGTVIGIPSREGEEEAEKDQVKRVTSSSLHQQVLCPQEEIILEIRGKPCSAEEQGGGVSGCGPRPATWPPWRAVPLLHGHEASLTGPGTPLPLAGALSFPKRQRGPRGTPGQKEPLRAEEPSGTEAGLAGGGSRPPAASPHRHPALGPSWSQRTSSSSSVGAREPRPQPSPHTT